MASEMGAKHRGKCVSSILGTPSDRHHLNSCYDVRSLAHASESLWLGSQPQRTLSNFILNVNHRLAYVIRFPKDFDAEKTL